MTHVAPADNHPADEAAAGAELVDLRSRLQGVLPLDGRIEPWMVETLKDERLGTWVEQNGSPLNLLSRKAFERNLERLRRVGTDRQLDFDIYFARKANKCLEFVEACRDLDAGVDTASYEELRQAIDVGVPAAKLICTAAIKERPLLRLCAEHGVVVALDNLDEIHALQGATGGKPTPVALRVGGFEHRDGPLTTRFGFPVDQAADVLHTHLAAGESPLVLRGIQFHLDGYCSQQRVTGIGQSIELIDELRSLGHPIEFLDMGGGFPVNYLEQPTQWENFWKHHRASLQGLEPSLTYRDHPLGLTVDVENARVLGRPNVYPFCQSPVGTAWLESIFDSSVSTGTTLASAIASRGLQLRCEPGRALLDGAGVTVAKVIHRKRDAAEDLLVGVSMNRTQCRTGSDDFLVDPILIPNSSHGRRDRTEVGEGYLTGAYCTESEAILLRKLNFSEGVAVGDLIAFPNTAGYFMHFYECRSHQFPLAGNLFIDSRALSPNSR